MVRGSINEIKRSREYLFLKVNGKKLNVEEKRNRKLLGTLLKLRISVPRATNFTWDKHPNSAHLFTFCPSTYPVSLLCHFYSAQH